MAKREHGEAVAGLHSATTPTPTAQHMLTTRRIASILFCGLLTHAAATTTLAQAGPARALLPGARLFPGPTADPHEPRFAVGLLASNVFAGPVRERAPFTMPEGADPRTDWHGSAALGTTLPLLKLGADPHNGALLGIQAGVFGRFRMEARTNDALAVDWIIALPIEFRQDRVSGRARLLQRSAHLGDEFLRATGATRLGVGAAGVDGLVAYNIEHLRIYGGGAWQFSSRTAELAVLRNSDRQDRFLVQLGVDGDLAIPFQPGLELSGGMDLQAAERTGWIRTVGVVAGIHYRTPGRGAGLVSRWFDGVSPMGEFFLTPERFWSVELVIEI